VCQQPASSAAAAAEQTANQAPSVPSATSEKPLEATAEVTRQKDPWAPLDPHDPGSSTAVKPWRKGRTCRIPAELRASTAAAAAKKKKAAAAAAAAAATKSSSKDSAVASGVVVLNLPATSHCTE
jgi:hypothetical protein